MCRTEEAKIKNEEDAWKKVDENLIKLLTGRISAEEDDKRFKKLLPKLGQNIKVLFRTPFPGEIIPTQQTDNVE